jgi:hypothetical protein
MTDIQITERKRTKISTQNNEPGKHTHTDTNKPSPEDGNRTGFRNVVSFYCLFYVLGLYVCVCVFPGFFFCVGILVFCILWYVCVSFIATYVSGFIVFMYVFVQVCCSVVCNLVLLWFVCGCFVIWSVQVFSFFVYNFVFWSWDTRR